MHFFLEDSSVDLKEMHAIVSCVQPEPPDALEEQKPGDCTGQCQYIPNCYASEEAKCEQNKTISVCRR